MEYAKNLRLGGYDDWRLPTIDELKEVISSCGGIPTIYVDDDLESIVDKNINNNNYQDCYQEKGFSSDYYWSSTSNKNNSDNAWLVHFYSGNVGSYRKYVNYYYFVRCVRAGE